MMIEVVSEGVRLKYEFCRCITILPQQHLHLISLFVAIFYQLSALSVCTSLSLLSDRAAGGVQCVANQG